METGFCVIRFTEGEEVGRIAPFELVRCKDTKERFAPACSKDLPGDHVQVKWQRSLTKGSFSHDGYYDAEVLAISSSYKTALAKAKELDIRLAPSALLSLPASTTPLPRQRPSKVQAIQRAKKHSDTKRKKNEDKQECPSSRTSPSSSPSRKKKKIKVAENPASSPTMKKKKSKVAENPASRGRLSEVLSDAVKNNPLLRETDYKECLNPSTSPTSSPSRKKKKSTSAENPALGERLREALPDAVKNDPHLKQTDIKGRLNSPSPSSSPSKKKIKSKVAENPVLREGLSEVDSDEDKNHPVLRETENKERLNHSTSHSSSTSRKKKERTLAENPAPGDRHSKVLSVAVKNNPILKERDIKNVTDPPATIMGCSRIRVKSKSTFQNNNSVKQTVGLAPTEQSQKGYSSPPTRTENKSALVSNLLAKETVSTALKNNPLLYETDGKDKVEATKNSSADESSDDEMGKTVGEIDKANDQESKVDLGLKERGHTEHESDLEHYRCCSAKDHSDTENDLSDCEKDKSSGRDELLEDTLPKSVQSVSPTKSSSRSSSDGSEEDDISKLCKLVDENEVLSKKAQSLGAKLDETTAQFNVANNLRIKYKQEVAKYKEEIVDLKKQISLSSKQVALLEKRNSTLQDLLSEKFTGFNLCAECSHSNKSSSPKYLSGQSKFAGQPSGSASHHEFQTEKEKSKNSNAMSRSCDDQIATSSKEISHMPPKSKSLDDIDKNDSSDNIWDDMYPNFDGNPTAESTPKKGTPPKKESCLVTPPKKESSTKNLDWKKKKGSKDRFDFSTNENVNLVCSNVFKHLKGTDTLNPDKEGRVNVGLNVKVPKKKMEEIFQVNKLDLQKISKNLAAMTWTVTERQERSLEGGVNNRFPNVPPKKAATPKKVEAVLGMVKAHMLNCGDKDGPLMAAALKDCRKAIGNKFAQDSGSSKQRRN